LRLRVVLGICCGEYSEHFPSISKFVACSLFIASAPHLLPNDVDCDDESRERETNRHGDARSRATRRNARVLRLTRYRYGVLSLRGVFIVVGHA
jgi:hypothetical protein